MAMQYGGNCWKSYFFVDADGIINVIGCYRFFFLFVTMLGDVYFSSSRYILRVIRVIQIFSTRVGIFFEKDIN